MVATIFTTPKVSERLTQLWDDLRADPVPPHPAVMLQKQVGTLLETSHLVQMAPRMEPVASRTADHPKPVRRRIWKVDLTNLFHNLLELEGAEVSPHPEAFLDVAVETDHDASLSSASPFRWEPKPAWISTPAHSSSPLLNPADPLRFAARPKIPRRALHKQPLYMRILFCLRRWLSRKSMTTV